MSRFWHSLPIDDLHLQLLDSARVSQAVFEPITQIGSAERSDSMLDPVRAFLQTDPPSISHLRPIEGRRDWLTEFKARLFEAFHEGLAISRYHLDRAELIENEIREIAERHETALLPRKGMVIGLSCRPLVAEYQAFEMALRRSLEYLAGTISAYFKTDGNRIRTLATTINGREPAAASAAVVARLEDADIEKLIGSRSGSKSIRDRVAHHESVSPGVVNIGHKTDGSLWVRLHGDAEDLNPLGSEETQALSEALEERVQRVENLALGLFEDLGLVPR